MTYAGSSGPKAFPSLARRPVLVGHGDKVGRTKASEFLFSIGKLREIRGSVLFGGFLFRSDAV